MGKYLNKVFLIYWKDIRDEVRSFDNLLSTILFGVMLIFIFSFAFQLADLDVEQAFSAILWVSIFFSSVLAIQRSFAKEEENNVLDGLLLGTGDRGSIFLAKFLCNLTILLIFEAVITPLLWIFIGASGVKASLGLLVPALFLGSWGLAAIGTMLNGMTVQLPAARLLFPILLFPLMVPVLVAVIQCTAAAFAAPGESVAAWLYFLASFDLLFVIVPLLLFDYILEG
ncbi:MAG: hypothetical protein GX335_09300 [Firmicutes bacterium]|nr:hypothetical protein [Bacillota bacterium]